MAGERITPDEALNLLRHERLTTLGALADLVRLLVGGEMPREALPDPGRALGVGNEIVIPCIDTADMPGPVDRIARKKQTQITPFDQQTLGMLARMRLSF